VAYIFLAAGIWALVFAVSIPGTGLPEASAIICLALAALGLVQLPVNLAGLGLIGLSLILFILEFRVMAHGALLGAGTLAFAIGSLLLFRTRGAEAALSWMTVLLVTSASTVGFGFLLTKGLAVQRTPPAQDLNRVVGSRGVARTDVNGQGTVYVSGELWSAQSETKIPAGSSVVVVERDGLHLKVAKSSEAAAG
jgi:membrane-bound serine protease (ClpP class)